jgi:succinate dehydrogenase / fumarate reductase, cytochrome b subunit
MTSPTPRPTRPLSPHLQIYKWQMSMFGSIMHRATGAALSVGALFVLAWLFSVATGLDAYVRFYSFTQSVIGQLMMAGWVFCLMYHLLNGIRHLGWDSGTGFDIKTANRTGWMVFTGAFLLTALFWFTR